MDVFCAPEWLIFKSFLFYFLFFLSKVSVEFGACPLSGSRGSGSAWRVPSREVGGGVVEGVGWEEGSSHKWKPFHIRQKCCPLEQSPWLPSRHIH